MLALATAASFPSDNVSRDVKDKPEYGRQVAQAIYYRWYNAAVPYGFANMSYFRMLRDYAEGRQSTAQYKKKYRGEGNKDGQQNASQARQGASENKRKGYNNISFDIAPVAPTYINIIKSILSQSDYKPTFVSTTKSDIKTKSKMKWKLYAEVKEENRLRQELGKPLKQHDFQPKSKGELEIYEQYYGFRLPLEVALTKVAEHSLDVGKWKLLRDQWMDTLIQTNFIAGRVITNNDGSTSCEYIETANFICSYYDQRRQQEPPFAGHVTKVTISSIADKLKEQGATDEEIQNMARKYLGVNGVTDPTSFNFNIKDPVTQRYQWYDFQVDVMHFEWKTDTPKKFVGRNAKNGNYVYKQEDRVKTNYADGRERKTDTYYQQEVYEGTWIIGTKWVIDYGLKKNMLRNPDGSCALSYFFERIDKKSIVDGWVSLLDDHQMGVLKLRAAVQAAAPKGLNIDVGLLAQMDLGGGKLNALELARLRRETGNNYYSTTAEMRASGRNGAAAITELENGIGQQLNEWLVYIQSTRSEIQRVAGITDAAAAMPNQSGEKGLGVSQIELNSTNNALYPLQQALVNFKMKCAQKMVAQTRLNIEADAKCRAYWENYLEPQEFAALVGIQDLTLNGIGIQMRATYSPERKAMIMNAATESLKAGKNGLIGINLSDYMLIERTLEEGYGELAAWYLTIAEERARVKNEEAQVRMSTINSENSIAANQAAMESKARMEQMLSQLRTTEDGQKIAAELEADLMKKEVEHQYRMRELALEGSIQASTGREVKGKI